MDPLKKKQKKFSRNSEYCNTLQHNYNWYQLCVEKKSPYTPTPSHMQTLC